MKAYGTRPLFFSLRFSRRIPWDSRPRLAPSGTLRVAGKHKSENRSLALSRLSFLPSVARLSRKERQREHAILQGKLVDLDNCMWYTWSNFAFLSPIHLRNFSNNHIQEAYLWSSSRSRDFLLYTFAYTNMNTRIISKSFLRNGYEYASKYSTAICNICVTVELPEFFFILAKSTLASFKRGKNYGLGKLCINDFYSASLN